jgi:hypothetical protein
MRGDHVPAPASAPVSGCIPRRHARIAFVTVVRFLPRFIAHLKQFGGNFIDAPLSVRIRTDSAMTPCRETLVHSKPFPVILVTDYDDLEALKQFGESRILQKPYTESDLANRARTEPARILSSCMKRSLCAVLQPLGKGGSDREEQHAGPREESRPIGNSPFPLQPRDVFSRSIFDNDRDESLQNNATRIDWRSV